jgi:hypothetical protein
MLLSSDFQEPLNAFGKADSGLLLVGWALSKAAAVQDWSTSKMAENQMNFFI